MAFYSAYQWNAYWSGQYQIARAVETAEQPSGGSGYPVYGEVVRPPSIKEILDVAMSDIYEAGTAEDVPKATREQFAKAVKPYAKGRAKIPEVDNVDWKALENDVEKVEQLLALWQMMLDDEEVIIMAYLQYYH